MKVFTPILPRQMDASVTELSHVMQSKVLWANLTSIVFERIYVRLGLFERRLKGLSNEPTCARIGPSGCERGPCAPPAPNGDKAAVESNHLQFT